MKRSHYAVVVLGMHRSGTSLLAQIMGRLDVALGSDVLRSPAADNKYGYWEHREIAMTQDFLLASLGRMWHEPRGVLPLPEGWLDSEAARAAAATLTGIVRHETEAAGSAVWGFKDPRTLRFLPLWDKVFAACGVTPLYILAVRRPDSVAASLVKRNGMSVAQARFLWLQHNLAPFGGRRPAAIAATIDYDLWFDRPARNMARLLRALPSRLKLRTALELCAPALDADERHHVAPGAASLADRIYRVLIDPMPERFRLYRLRRQARQFDDAAVLLRAWQDMIERCHAAGPLPFEAWKT